MNRHEIARIKKCLALLEELRKAVDEEDDEEDINTQVKGGTRDGPP